jgi:alkyl sulfatase BDS1-like metallo-beta-lactamase superfamily hydrolase
VRPRVIGGLTYEFLYAPNPEASTEMMIYIKEKKALNATEDATQRVLAQLSRRNAR